MTTKQTNFHNKRGPDGKFIKKNSKPTAKKITRKKARRRTKKPIVSKTLLTNEVALVVDVSSSMGGYESDLAEAINSQVTLYSNCPDDQQSFISIYLFHSYVERLVGRCPANQVRKITSSDVQSRGMTAMLDGIGDAINELEASHRARDKNTSFFVMGFTDGHENRSRSYTASSISSLIREKQNAGNWTIAFMGPRGSTGNIRRFTGIATGNIEEWNAGDVDGVRQMGNRMVDASKQYMSMRTAGVKSSNTLFVDAKNLNENVLDANLTDRSNDFAVWNVTAAEGRAKGAKKGGSEIADFVNAKLSRPANRKAIRGSCYEKTEARAFYELTKSEKVQHYKQIAVMTPEGYIYTGAQARTLLGLPNDNYGEVRVRPGDLGDNRLFISSTSGNRILMAGTSLLYLKQ